MTVRDIALRLLKMIGVYSLDPSAQTNAANVRGINPDDLNDLIACINGAMQECLEEGPSSLSSIEAGGVLMAPATITLAVVQYSPAIASQPTGWADWMNECTVRITGDAWDNRLRFNSSTNTYSFQRPVMCATGTVAATVYCDALLVPYKNVVDPVCVGERQLEMVGGMDRLQRRQQRWGCGSRITPGSSVEIWPEWYLRNQRPVGQPRICFADTTFNPTLTSVPVYLRVSPMPTCALPITYTGKASGPSYTVADIDNGDHETDPGTEIPEQWEESMFLPIAKKIWSENPLCVLSEAQITAIGDQYAKAIKRLQSWRPSIGKTEAQYL